MSRAMRFAILVLVVCALVGVAAPPAYAGHVDGTIYKIAPKGNAPKSGTTKITAADGSDGVAAKRVYTASNSKTKFYVITGVDGEGRQIAKRVSRNTFVKYLNSSGGPAWFDWKWKKRSNGTKYRYINRITASKFVS